MTLDNEVTAWIAGLRESDAVATQRLWEQYFPQLVKLAAARLPAGMRRESDEEDAALSAMASLCRGMAAGRYPAITDRDGLWALLIVITQRKCRAQIRRQTALKRGGGRTEGESALGGPFAAGLTEEICRSPTPQFAAEMAEQVGCLLAQLADPVARELALLKMNGYSNAEAADKLNCSRTTVERRLRLIRKTWCEAVPV